jgi:DNA replication protein DnaD
MWYEERFSKGQAWVDLLLLANHSDKKILFNRDFTIIKRGQYLTSMVRLAEKWKWDRKTVAKYLKLLEKDKMITLDVDNHKTLITIDNYRVYQHSEDDTLDNDMDNGVGNPMDNSMVSGMDTNKNDKECIRMNKNEEEKALPIFSEHDDTDEEEGWGYE